MPTTILAATAVAGLGLSAYGYMEQKAGRDTAAAGAQKQAEGARIQSYGAEMQASGSLRQVEGARVQNEANKAITGLEFQAEEQRMKAMEVDARRKTMEIIRNQQRARALGLTAATSQGASYGSGLQGGYGQISGQANENLLGVGQNLAIGRAIFGINSGISQQRLNYAGGGDIINEGSGIIAQGAGWIAKGGGVVSQGAGVIAQGAGQTATGQGLSSLGGQLVQSAPTFANVSTTFGSGFGNWFSQPSMTSYGGTYSGLRNSSGFI